MTLARTRNHFPGAPAGFDHHAAEVVYGIVSKLDDDTAEMFADIIVGSLHQQALEDYDVEIRKNLDGLMARYGDRLRADMTRAYISKRAAGEPVDGLLAAATVISKDFQGFSAQQRAENAKKENRDLTSGRFVKSHHDIGYTSHDNDGKRIQPAHDKEAERFGIPTPRGANQTLVKLTDQQKLAYQQAYSQVAAIMAGHQRNPEGKFLHLHYAGELAPEVHELPGQGDAAPLDPKRRLRSVSVSVIPGHEDADSYDTLGAMTNAVAQNYGAGNQERAIQGIRDLDTGLHPGPFQPLGSAAMTRLGASSKFLDDSFRNDDGKSVLPRKAQAALKAGQVVGVYGPEAARVIGPTADKTAYRYRGTERAPDRPLVVAQAALRRNPSLKSAEDRREVAVHGLETDSGWHPSGILNYFRSRLPNADLNALQRGSGSIPPSEGVIFDKDGKIVTQAVGYGDDHYLPFNLGKLRGLRGGEYVRTRTYGGPTTEDLYTGLVGGAKAMSVVSHNGVYTVEFDQGFTGKRRYNDKAARMIARYGYLLDAVKNGKITTGVMDPSREQEIHDTAALSYDPDTEPQEYANEVNRLMLRESRNPTLSVTQKRAAASEFLDDEALKHHTVDGHEMTRDEFVDSWLDRQSKGDTDFKREIAQRSGLTTVDPADFNDAAIRAMGLSDRYGKFLERKERDYRQSLKPLSLNGPGYNLALQALQEQFPYYIKSVDYHPWADARTNVDTGYVHPKANRSADVLSGYFHDENVAGTGKVLASTTRGQQRTPKEYRGTAQRVADRAKAGAERLTGSTSGGPGISPGAARELRMQGDAAMAAEIRRHQHFGTSFHGAGVRGLENADGARGDSIGSFPSSELARIHPAFGEVRGMSDDDVRRAQSTPEGADAFHRKLKDVVAAIRKHSAVDLSPEVMRGFEAEGKPEAPRRFDKDAIGHHLRNPDAELDFPGRPYRKDSGATQGEIEDAMAGVTGDPKGVLPHRNQLADERDDLAKRNGELVKWEANPLRSALNRPKGSETLARDVEKHLKKRQLLRRWEEAQPPEEAADEGGIGFAGGGGQHVVIHLDNGGNLQPISPSASSSDQGFMQQHGMSWT